MTRKQRIIILIVTVVVVLAILFLPSMFYIVDQREMAVVLQFGRPIAERIEPGLYPKIPWIQNVLRLPATRQFWGGEAQHVLPDLPTKDGKKVDVMPWAVWRVKEPKSFVTRLRTVANAEQRVAQFVRGAVRDIITQYELAELVRSTDRELTYSFSPEQIPMQTTTRTVQVQDRRRDAEQKIEHGREQILQQIKADAIHRLASESADKAKEGESSGRGIELIDVGISQIDFVPKVREAAFDRLVAFMESIAALYENEGQREKQEILNRTKAEVERIEGEGTQRANELRGEADADIITMYAKAITEAGEFYTFVRTLDAYKDALGTDTRLILTTDSEFLKFFKELGPPPTLKAPPTTQATK